ncbi:MAG: hypothetical protein M3355_11625 [Actinomycetota bacterium]|nr:hypothetical protein [Actinomycetota bacterium]
MSRLAASLLLAAGTVHVILATAAITGAARLEENVREIGTSPVGGDLFFSLAVWGWIFGVAATFELVAAWRLYGTGPRARLAGLIAGFLALGAVFLSLPIFRWPAVATIPLLLAATYLLAYRVADEA